MIVLPEPAFDPISFLASNSSGQSTYREGDVIFAQGDEANCVFYVRSGRIKKSYISNQGKERIVTILHEGDFLGVGCVIGHKKRLFTAAAMTACSVVRTERSVMIRALYEQP